MIIQCVFSLTYFKQKRHLWQPFLDERKGYYNLDLFCLRTITVISYMRLKNIIYKQFLSFLAHRILRKGFLPAINHGEFQIIFCILDQPMNFNQSKEFDNLLLSMSPRPWFYLGHSNIISSVLIWEQVDNINSDTYTEIDI